MGTLTARLVSAALALMAGAAWAQPGDRTPYIGYAYPAGGRQGAVLQVTVGGQYLRGVTDAYISGGGARASVVKFSPPVGVLNGEQLREIRRRLTELVQKGQGAAPAPAQPPSGDQKPVDIPDIPLLRNLEDRSVQELTELTKRFFNPKNLLPTQRAIAETVLIEVTIDRDAEPGERELRLGAPIGLTNPIRFEVGQLSEVAEREPNDPEEFAAEPVEVPVTFNGQIGPGDVDLLRFWAAPGQRLVIDARARRLIPYLADAVPGWFQATLTLYDSKGGEVAFSDDYGFSPDPVLFYEVEEDGEYTLEIRDAIYRGREDFVYRVSVSEQPFITAMFPLGGRAGVATVASLTGRNLPTATLELDTQPGPKSVRETELTQGRWLSNPVSYAVDTLPECDEIEPNDRADAAQPVSLPGIVNGRIAKPDDVDMYRFQGLAGDEIVAEVCARRLGSQLDSVLRLIDPSEAVVVWNDDHEDPATGLLTHHADSYLRAKLPSDGTYCLQVSDADGHGGDAYGYRLRVGPPRPGFDLLVTPSAINVPAGHAAPFSVRVVRRDGFDGGIEVSLVDAPPGFALSGARIPAGRDSIQMTLTAPIAPSGRPIPLRLEGRALSGGATVTRLAEPVDDMMQAFAYHHLVPAKELLAMVTNVMRLAPVFAMAQPEPVRIPSGGTAEVRIAAPRLPPLLTVQLELSDPPDGIAIRSVTRVPGGLSLVLQADGQKTKAGYADNLIVKASTEIEVGGRNGQAARRQRVSLGTLPAIPLEIVGP